jgi:VanZ family protein
MAKDFKNARRLVVVILAVYWLAIAIGTHLPNQVPSPDFISDKVMHFVAFGGLAFLLSCSLMRGAPSWRLALGLLAIAVCYGAIDEITQGLVPTREPEFKDWLADSFGAMSGMVMYLAIFRMVKKRDPVSPTVWSPKAVPVNDAA